MSPQEREQQLLASLGAIQDPQARLGWVVEQGRRSPRLPAEFCTDSQRVEGCLSNLWFVPEAREGRCYYRTDSDSAIVRGIAVVLCEFYNGLTPSEILSADPGFLARVGITQHLTPNRRNALSRLWEKIRGFAETQLESKPLDGPA